MSIIYIVGEAWGEQEEAAGRPFVGPSGSVLRGLMGQSGLSDHKCILDNVFNLRPSRNDVETLMTKDQNYADTSFGTYKPKMWVHRDFAHHVRELRERVSAAAPDIILALGNTPLWALAGFSGIGKWRGSPMMSLTGHKLLATYHPAAILRQWKMRPVVFMDFCKAVRIAPNELRRPSRIITYAPTLEEIESFYHEFIVPAEIVSCDIETKGRQITEVGYAPSPSRALVIPFFSRNQRDGNYWRSLEEELVAWSWVRRINAEKRIVGQNFQYDAQYFWKEMGIPIPRWTDDTMILHHSMQPELEKGLGFLGSIYTDEPAWKFMRAESTLKKED